MSDDVKLTEGTVAESSPAEEPASNEPNVSEDENTQEASTSDEEIKIPKSRFDEVNTRMKTYKELLEARDPEKVKEAVTEAKETVKVDEDKVEQLVNQKINEVLKKQESGAELQQVMTTNPDFINYKDQIKEQIKSNPHMGWQDAYDLVKFRSQQGPSKPVASPQEKVAAVVEGSTASPKLGDGELDPLAKGPDGKFLYSREELEKILPKGTN